MTKAAKFFTSHRFSHFTLIVADMLGVVAGFRLAFLIYIQWGLFYVGEAASPSLRFYLALAAGILPFYWLLFKLHGLYRFRLNLSVLEIFPAIAMAATEASMVLLGVTMLIFPVVHYSRSIIIMSWIITIVCVSTARLIICGLQRHGRKHGWYVKNALVLGAGKVGISCANKLIANPDLGLRFVGFLDEKPSSRAAEFGSYHVFTDYSKLEEILAQYHIQHMVVGFSRDRHDTIVELMERCRPYNIEFTMVPRLYEIFSDSMGMEHIRGLPVLGLKRSSLKGFGGMVKRTMDIAVSLAALMLLSPVLLLVAIAIKLDSPGPVFYRQVRLGKKERPFEIYKFRSMRADVRNESKNGQGGWSTAGDLRRTRVGRIIRPLGIDELPQLINVINGEMSLVGPRPEQPEFVESFKKTIPAYGSRHRVRPGLTGWAQINGLRGDTDIAERVEHDIYYIENWNPWLDIKIVLKTLIAFVDRNA